MKSYTVLKQIKVLKHSIFMRKWSYPVSLIFLKVSRKFRFLNQWKLSNTYLAKIEILFLRVPNCQDKFHNLKLILLDCYLVVRKTQSYFAWWQNAGGRPFSDFRFRVKKRVQVDLISRRLNHGCNCATNHCIQRRYFIWNFGWFHLILKQTRMPLPIILINNIL